MSIERCKPTLGMNANEYHQYDTRLIKEVEDASASGELSILQSLIERWLAMKEPNPPRDDPIYPLAHFSGALFSAIRNQHLHVIGYLLDKGCPITRTASVEAVVHVKSIPVLQTMRDHGWDFNNRPGSGSMPLKFALQDEVLRKWFLTNGANPTAHDDMGYCALDTAAGYMSITIVKDLLLHGAEPRLSNALQAAARCKDGNSTSSLEKMACLLQYGARIDALEYEWDPELFREKLKLSPTTALHIAVDRGDEEMVVFLLQRGASPNVKNTWDETPTEKAGRLAIPRLQRIAAILRGEIEVTGESEAKNE